MKKFLHSAALAALFAAVLAFSIENRGTIFISLFPFKAGVEMPIYLYTICLLFAGALAGAAAAALSGGGKTEK